jgi:hypothetical protein
MSGYGYQWPAPADDDVLRALLGAIGDMKRGLAPKTEELLVIFAWQHAADGSVR